MGPVHDAWFARNVEMISSAQIVASCGRVVGHVLGRHLVNAHHRGMVERVDAS
jgi:hypothetical protein